MTKPRLEVLRKGALVRVAGGPNAEGAEVRALAFLDFRFDDGHVERWLGPGSIGALPSESVGLATLWSWAAEACEEFAGDVAAEAAADFSAPSPAQVDELRCSEVVVEWNARLDAL